MLTDRKIHTKARGTSLPKKLMLKRQQGNKTPSESLEKEKGEERKTVKKKQTKKNKMDPNLYLRPVMFLLPS